MYLPFVKCPKKNVSGTSLFVICNTILSFEFDILNNQWQLAKIKRNVLNAKSINNFSFESNL